MSAQGLAIFVLVMFLLPVPVLSWLDRGPRTPGPTFPGTSPAGDAEPGAGAAGESAPPAALS